MIRKSKITLLIVFALSLGCSKQAENVSETMITDIETFNKILDEFDSTGELKKSLSPDDTKNALKVLQGKSLCPCYPHETGQAHFHTDNTLSFAADRKTPLVGMLKRYIPTIDVNHKPGLKPCYLLFVNNLRRQFTDCQHISDTLGHDAFKVKCLDGGTVQLAYNLDPVDLPHPSEGAGDCH